MTSTFLLDLRKLDFSVDSKVREARIEAEAVAYFEQGKRPHYAFYQNLVDKEDIPLSLLKLSRSEYEIPSGEEILELRLHYEAGIILFRPFSDTLSFRNGSTEESWRKELKSEFEALYVEGNFVKGDIKTFKRYGIEVLAEGE